MSLEAINELSLDFKVPKIRSVRCIQGDKNTLRIHITLTSNGQKHSLDPKTMFARCEMLTPSGSQIMRDCTIDSDGTVFLSLTDDIVFTVGTIKAQIQVIQSNTQQILTSMPFNIMVYTNLLDEERVQSANDYTSLKNMFLRMDKVINTAEGYLLEFPTWMSNENERLSNEQNRVTAEMQRVNSTTSVINGAQKAVSDAQEAVGNAQSATSNAQNAASNAQKAVSDANTALSTANTTNATAKRVVEDCKNLLKQFGDAMEPGVWTVIQDGEPRYNVHRQVWIQDDL